MEQKRYPISAHYVAKSLPLQAFEKRSDLPLLTKRRNSLVFKLSDEQLMYVYAFGVVALFNFDKKAAGKAVRQALKLGLDPLEKAVADEYEVVIDPERKISVEFEAAYLPRLDPDQLGIVAEVLAQSAAIEFVEGRVAEIVDRFRKVTEGLEEGGRIRSTDKEVMKVIGSGRSIVQYVVASLALLDKPEQTWEDKELESLFTAMRKMFELEDRFRAIEFRLDFIHETSSLVLDILENKRSVNLELWIIFLFVIDLVLVVYEIWFK